jgi:long-chain acyl-CoA synthetase
LQIRREAIPIDDKSDAAVSNFLKDHIRFINRKMPAYKAVKYFVFSDQDMIRTTTMKVRRFEEMEAINRKLSEKEHTMRSANGRNIDQLSRKN